MRMNMTINITGRCAMIVASIEDPFVLDLFDCARAALSSFLRPSNVAWIVEAVQLKVAGFSCILTQVSRRTDAKAQAPISQPWDVWFQSWSWGSLEVPHCFCKGGATEPGG